MAKVKTSFFCQNCGAQYSKWQGQCNACKEWNTIAEEIIQKEEKTLGLDIIVITQALAGRRDTGRVEPGQESQYQKWFNYE